MDEKYKWDKEDNTDTESGTAESVPEEIDLRKLIIYSEIMSPKFDSD